MFRFVIFFNLLVFIKLTCLLWFFFWERAKTWSCVDSKVGENRGGGGKGKRIWSKYMKNIGTSISDIHITWAHPCPPTQAYTKTCTWWEPLEVSPTRKKLVETLELPRKTVLMRESSRKGWAMGMSVGDCHDCLNWCGRPRLRVDGAILWVLHCIRVEKASWVWMEHVLDPS